ncbi:MAG: TRAP transporter small permease, partial [Desulfobacterales bacterium]
KLPPALLKLFDLIGYLGFLVFCMILIIWGTNLCLEIKKFSQLSAAMQLPMYIPYLAVPLGGVAMGVRLLQKIHAILGGPAGQTASEQETYHP